MRWILICLAAAVTIISSPLITTSDGLPLDDHGLRPSGRSLKGPASSCAPGSPHFLITYASYSMHTKSLARALAGGLVSAGLQEGCIRAKSITESDLYEDVLAWADAVIVGGPVERGTATHAVSSFVTALLQLQESHPSMKGKVACGFGTGGAVSARAEAMVGHMGQQLTNASYTVPLFTDSWHFSTGLVAITGESPFCQVGQTDRFPHETGAKAVIHGCEVGSDKPPGSLHPQFVALAEEYAERLHGFVLEHVTERRKSVPELEDRVVLDEIHAPADIDWGEFGEDSSRKKPLLRGAGGVLVLFLATVVWQLSVRLLGSNCLLRPRAAEAETEGRYTALQ